MIYLDSSVALAALLSEDRRPDAAFWAQDMASSRLMHYEVIVNLQARRAAAGILRSADSMFRRLVWVEMKPPMLARALDPFPKLAMLRTLDALHLASADYLRENGGDIEIATYDKRLAAGTKALGFALAKL